MIIGIIGSRRRATPQDFSALKRKLVKLGGKNGRGKLKHITKIVTGDCKTGGDKFARIIAENKGIEIDVKFKLDLFNGKIWEQEFDDEGKKIFVGKDAYTKMCYARNIEIAKEKMDRLVCLVSRDRTGGTEHTIEQFKKENYDWEERLILV